MNTAEMMIHAPMGYHWVWSQAAQDAADYLGFASRRAGTPIFAGNAICDTSAPVSLLEKGYVDIVPLRSPSTVPDLPVYIALEAGALLASGRISPLDIRELVHQILGLAHNYELTHYMDEDYLKELEDWAAHCLINIYGFPVEG